MNKDTILEMLSSDSECLSLQEVYNILNEELEKSPEEMDTDLIELCIDAIESANSEKVNNKRVKLRIRKALIAAVIFVLVIAISVPVCAKFFNVNVPNGIVEFYGNHFNIDISNDEYVDDILVELEKNGIENPALPTIVFLEDTKIYDLHSNLGNDINNITFKFNAQDLTGAITIQYFDNNSYSKNTQSKIDSDTELIESFFNNDINIVLYINDSNSYIEYTKDNYNYVIELKNCDYETAYEIANSI